MGTEKYASVRSILHLKSSSCKISLKRFRLSILNCWYGKKVFIFFRFIIHLSPHLLFLQEIRCSSVLLENETRFEWLLSSKYSWSLYSLSSSVRHSFLLNVEVFFVLDPSRVWFDILLKLAKFPDPVSIPSSLLENGFLSWPTSNLGENIFFWLFTRGWTSWEDNSTSFSA